MPRGQWLLLIERANVPHVQTKDNIPATFTETPGSGRSERSSLSCIGFNFHEALGSADAPDDRPLVRRNSFPGRKQTARSFGRNFYGKFRSLDMFTRRTRQRRHRERTERSKKPHVRTEYERDSGCRSGTACVTAVDGAEPQRREERDSFGRPIGVWRNRFRNRLSISSRGRKADWPVGHFVRSVHRGNVIVLPANRRR